MAVGWSPGELEDWAADHPEPTSNPSGLSDHCEDAINMALSCLTLKQAELAPEDQRAFVANIHAWAGMGLLDFELAEIKEGSDA